ncbi:MAG: hypothetical protein WBM70_01415 [Sulfurovum sp.]|jgi:hypothetical protein|uniref:hypothetical protein n=1 Tax=Sulfurovum sp. TaxID=1969726 RepID=UPI003C76651B
MQTDFKPVHLKQANDKLDELISSSEKEYEQYKDENVKKSLWKKFLGLFKTSPFELPEDLYKGK